jgi:hypothetical protein
VTRRPSIACRLRRLLTNRHALTGLGAVGGILGVVASRHSIAWLGTVGACLTFYVAAMHQQAPKAKP